MICDKGKMPAIKDKNARVGFGRVRKPGSEFLDVDKVNMGFIDMDSINKR